MPILRHLLLVLVAAGTAAGEDRISFLRTRLDAKFRSEGVAVADFNNDGRADIAAGSVWYAAPDWEMHSVAPEPAEFDPLQYSNSFCNFADDVDGDGWQDLLVVDFPGAQTWWWKNPGDSGGDWVRHVATPVTNNESPQFVDYDGDGVRELLLAFSPDPDDFDGPLRRMGFARRTDDPTAPWRLNPISVAAAPGTTRFSHGLGLGDVNSDGRPDVLVPAGWWEQPPAESTAEVWPFHAVPFGEACAHMYAHDFDGDGDADVVSSSAHAVGLWWHEQTDDGWRTHLIFDQFSQSHALELADMNGDGRLDLVTGKRWWAHGPTGDVDPGADAVVYWFELGRTDGRPQWTPHLVDRDSGVGTQFQVADVNGDDLLDVVVSNKKGVFYHEQVRMEQP